jgi:hypothetical protein
VIRRLTLVAVVAGLALAVSGCGGTAGPKRPASAGADFAPKSSVAFVEVDTQVEGSQWRAADELLQRFPARERLLDEVRRSIDKQLSWDRDVKPALGNAVYVVWLDFRNDGADAVGFAKPHDAATFDRLLESGDDPSVHRVIDGWTVFADTNALLDRFQSERSSGSLSDDDAFRDATADAPADALAKAYVNGEAVGGALDRALAGERGLRVLTERFGRLRWISAAAVAEGGGASVKAAADLEGGEKPASYSAVLPGDVPAGAMADLSFGRLREELQRAISGFMEANPTFARQLAQVEQALGLSLDRDVLSLFGKEGGVALYSGRPYPSVLLALAVDDERGAQRVLDRIAALVETAGGVGTSREITIDGVRAKEFSPSGASFSIFAAVSRRRLLLASSEATLRAALERGTSLADDARFRDALAAGDFPHETTGFVYLNPADLVPLLGDLEVAQPGDNVRKEIRENSRPLQSLLVYATQDGDTSKLNGFLRIR